ncbi:hypothetical protein SEA_PAULODIABOLI_45 [Microbacterium phage PauloDiaboli]|nr:hypothetical protein SEA_PAULODIABOLI_45 [Microbacterium phage PauloDiaboli]QWY83895.1 hypothetical protein SEA_A3WALLY_45 [Microbacterium phage A3Wally]
MSAEVTASTSNSLFDFLARNHDSSRKSESSWAVHKISLPVLPVHRWVVFCWHEAIGAKYWIVKSYSDAVLLGEKHLEVGERVANEGRTSR